MLSKKNIFRIILFLIPIVVLVSLELILRLTGYENNLNIVSSVERNNKNYYTINQLVGKRYFDEDRLYYKKGAHDYFEVNKQPNTIRIFCFGESTTAGFPYEYNATPTEFLKERLNNALPDKNIEVINTAIAATNSFTVNEFAKELVKYNPDLFIVYMGQNEFYGVYGVGSTISVGGGNRWIIKTYLWLQQFKTFLLLKKIINSISDLFKSDSSEEDKLLMEQMAENHSIRYNDSDYKTAVKNFKENYAELIETAKENKIPIIISTLVINEGDLPPFVSLRSETLNDTLKKKGQILFDSGIKEQMDGKYQNAISYFKKSLVIDSLPANVHYKLAECYKKLGQYKDAKAEFSLARDLDGLRFRAPSEFNLIIKNLADAFKVPLADVNKEFKENSFNDIIGSDLLMDHVHPNIKGYFLLSKTWFNAIKGNNLVGLPPGITENDSLIWQQIAVTSLDSIIGELKIAELRSKPPFKDTISDLNFEPNNFIEEIAYQYTIKHQISWGTAHLNAAKIYLNNNDYSAALREFRAILIIESIYY